MAEQIELHYMASSGHDWILRYMREDRSSAIDAVFHWLLTMDEFGVKELGVFLAAILHDAIEQGVFTQESYVLVEKLIYAIPKTNLDYDQQVNMMRTVLLTALDSGE
jgi:hypothetical protein